MLVNEWESSATLSKDSSLHKFQTLCIQSGNKTNTGDHSDSYDVMLYLAASPSIKTLCQKCHLFPECASFLYMHLCQQVTFDVLLKFSLILRPRRGQALIENSLFESMSCASLCATLENVFCFLRLCLTGFILKDPKRDLQYLVGYSGGASWFVKVCCITIPGCVTTTTLVVCENIVIMCHCMNLNCPTDFV